MIFIWFSNVRLKPRPDCMLRFLSFLFGFFLVYYFFLQGSVETYSSENYASWNYWTYIKSIWICSNCYFFRSKVSVKAIGFFSWVVSFQIQNPLCLYIPFDWYLFVLAFSLYIISFHRIKFILKIYQTYSLK